jgi:uroporphyrinogen-III synthase/uroporphyrinogen III methyltransferase/synthase
VTVVLNTRPREQAAELSHLLTRAGFEVVEAPAIAIVPAWNPAELDAVHRKLTSGVYQWVILASQNAARSLELYLESARVVCGASTANVLGLTPEISVERFSAAAARDALTGSIGSGDRVLVPRAAEGRDELIDGLRSLGAVVDAPVAYRTVAVADAAERLQRGDVDLVTLCSPSAVRSVASAIRRERIACLGNTTADAARQLGLGVDVVATTTSMDSLVEAIGNLLTVGSPVGNN